MRKWIMIAVCLSHKCNQRGALATPPARPIANPVGSQDHILRMLLQRRGGRKEGRKEASYPNNSKMSGLEAEIKGSGGC